MKNTIRHIIIYALFLIFSTPSVLSADSNDSKNIWQDNSCLNELDIRSVMQVQKEFLDRLSKETRDSILKNKSFTSKDWRDYVSRIFVGEVVWAQPLQEASSVCSFGVFNSRDVRHKIMEVLMGDLELDSEVPLSHNWCAFFQEKYQLGAKFIIGLNTRINRAPEHGKVAWELPFNPENREKAKNFIQCIHDKGIVKAMEKESE